MNKKIVDVENKIPDTSGLVTTAVLNTSIKTVQNKIPDHAKYIATPEFNNFSGSIFDTSLKQANLATNSDVNAVPQCVNKKKEKIEKLQTFDLSHFIGNVCFSTNI